MPAKWYFFILGTLIYYPSPVLPNLILLWEFCFAPMIVRSSKYGVIKLAAINSDDIEGVLLPGSSTFFTERDFRTMLIQEIRSERYLLQYSIFNFVKKITLFFSRKKIGLTSQLVLKGNLNIKTNEGERLKIREGQFLLFSEADKNEQIVFEKGKEYVIFDTTFSTEEIKKLTTAFPSLKEFINNEGASRTAKITRHPAYASERMTAIVYELLKCPYDEQHRKIYFETLRRFL
jgi:hypothetical protein